MVSRVVSGDFCNIILVVGSQEPSGEWVNQSPT